MVIREVRQMSVIMRFSIFRFRCTAAIRNELGIDDVLFSMPSTSAKDLIRDIHSVCTEQHNLQVNDTNFLRLFKLHNNHSKILTLTARAVEAFLDLKTNFDEERITFNAKDQVDLIFEFQAYMEQEITLFQQLMAEEFNFSFLGQNAANEAGHVANMTNQLRVILQAIRVEALSYQSDHGANDLRQCPHCGLLWAKVEGCDGGTTCGSIPATPNDLRDQSYGVMATFDFRWVKGSKAKKGNLSIRKRGTKKVKAQVRAHGRGLGCGASITWNAMRQVPVPPELMQGEITTDDVKEVPPGASGFRQTVTSMLNEYTSKMSMRLRSTKLKAHPYLKVFKK